MNPPSTQLLQLLHKNSPEVSTLRNRALNGNKQLLNNFSQTILSLLKNTNQHPLAYEQINHLLLTAQIPTINYMHHQNIFQEVAINHCRRELDLYIGFWKGLMNGDLAKLGFPNLEDIFKDIKVLVEEPEKIEQMQNFYKIFHKNLTAITEQKIQFFDDPEHDNSFITENDSSDNSQIIQIDLQQLYQIRTQVQSGPIDELLAQQQLKKIKNFLLLKPKSLKKELSLEFNNNCLWAKQFLQNYHKYLENGRLNLYQYFRESKASSSRNSQNIKNGNIVEYQQINQNQPINIHQNAQQIKYHEECFKKTNRKKYPIPPKKISIQDKNSNIKNQKISINQINTNQPILHSALQNNHTFQHHQSSKSSDRFPINQNPIQQPNFILTTEQMRTKKLNQSIQQHLPNPTNSRIKRKIFSSTSQQNRQQQPKQDDLLITKYGKIQNPQKIPYRPANSLPTNHNYQNQQQDQIGEKDYNANSPYHSLGKWSNQGEENLQKQLKAGNCQSEEYNYMVAANTPLPPQIPLTSNKLSYTKNQEVGSPPPISSSKKLSQLSKQKKQRKTQIAHQKIVPIEYCIIKPYEQNFCDPVEFSRFRRNCLQDCFVLYNSTILLITCQIKKIHESKIRIQLQYQNQSFSQLALETLYRIPKSLQIEKYSQIAKRWILKDQYQHIYSLELLSFPLSPCLLNLKHSVVSNCPNMKQLEPIVVSIPVTLRNFVEYYVLNEQEWIEKWKKWIQMKNFRISKNMFLDKHVVEEEELASAFRQLTVLSPVQGYSIKQFGGYCKQQKLNSLTFLLRISLRVDNKMTLQILAEKPIEDQNSIQFLQCSLNVWCMLLTKIDINTIY